MGILIGGGAAFWKYSPNRQKQKEGDESSQPPAPVVLQRNAKISPGLFPHPVTARYHHRVHGKIPGSHDHGTQCGDQQPPNPSISDGRYKTFGNHIGRVGHHEPGDRDKKRNQSEEFSSQLVGIVIGTIDQAGGYPNAFEQQADDEGEYEQQQGWLPAQVLGSMQQGKDKGEHGEQRGKNGMVGHAKKEADQGVNGEQGIDDEDQFSQLADEHGIGLIFIV